MQRGFAVGVEADVLPVGWRGAVAVEGDGGAGEVEGAAIGGGDDFDGVWIGDVFGGAEDFEGGDLDVRVGEGAKQGGEVFGLEEGFVTLDVDVDVGVEDVALQRGHGRSRWEGRGRQLNGPVVLMAEFRHFVRVRGDDDSRVAGRR